jgi:tRNA/tmRNA/rRNA uracil-C5-methylase (TrmA/RlmC/RlmD family)
MQKNRHRRPRSDRETVRPTAESIELTIERIIPGGYGLAHAEGQTVMIPLTAPGDRVRARVERKAGKVSFARLIEVLEPGPERVAAPCKYFGLCGGCDFQQLDYPAQLQAKAAIIEDCFRRIAKIELNGVEVVASPTPWAYRTRAEWQCDPDHGRLGYFERGSHRICDVNECPILTPALQTALTNIRGRLTDKDQTLPSGAIQVAKGNDGVATSPPLLADSRALVQQTVGNFSYQFGADNFFQANAKLLPALINEVVGDRAGKLALDLYCGVGLFSLPLAQRFETVRGVEGDPSAVELAQWNAGDAELTNALFDCFPVDQWLATEGSDLGSIDVLVLDPPRSGAGKEVIASIAALKPSQIVYVSCDPATLARDARQLTASGYEMTRVIGFDLFPQTHHVETVAAFGRQGIGQEDRG